MVLPSVETRVPELLRIRRIANRAFVGVAWALLALDASVAWVNNMSVAVAGGVALFGAVVGTAATLRDRDGLFGRLVLVICLMNDYDALIYATSYTPYQLDAHMLYFVLAALMISYSCWITLLTACLHTAVQHFTFNLLLPDFVYPGGADWVRFVYHAIILLTQFAGSAYLAASIHNLFDRNHRVLGDLRTASQEADESRRRDDVRREAGEAERARAQADISASAERQNHVVDEIAGGLERLAQGELEFRLETAFPAEYEKLRRNFNGAAARMREAIEAVVKTAGAIRAGAGDISGNAAELSRRALEQSASLKAQVASLDAINAELNRTAGGAGQAREVVAAAKQDAERGAAVVAEAVGAMNEIERSSGQIGQIIGVIDEIAFQTNLLALNAGVEAARAGEFGRGFAVVASEVRALAQRSAEAAKEIKALISTSSEQVGRGVGLVRRTGEALQRIVEEVAGINEVVVGIAGSIAEQSRGLGEVNGAVTEIDGGVQASADRFEQSAGATRDLADQTEQLERLVGFFRLHRRDAHALDRAA